MPADGSGSPELLCVNEVERFKVGREKTTDAGSRLLHGANVEELRVPSPQSGGCDCQALACAVKTNLHKFINLSSSRVKRNFRLVGRR